MIVCATLRPPSSLVPISIRFSLARLSARSFHHFRTYFAHRQSVDVIVVITFISRLPLSLVIYLSGVLCTLFTYSPLHSTSIIGTRIAHAHIFRRKIPKTFLPQTYRLLYEMNERWKSRITSYLLFWYMMLLCL